MPWDRGKKPFDIGIIYCQCSQEKHNQEKVAQEFSNSTFNFNVQSFSSHVFLDPQPLSFSMETPPSTTRLINTIHLSIFGSLSQFRKCTSVLALMEFLDRVDTIPWSVELVHGEINRIVRVKLGIGIIFQTHTKNSLTMSLKEAITILESVLLVQVLVLQHCSNLYDG
jgi:hypothetical protein